MATTPKAGPDRSQEPGGSPMWLAGVQIHVLSCNAFSGMLAGNCTGGRTARTQSDASIWGTCIASNGLTYQTPHGANVGCNDKESTSITEAECIPQKVIHLLLISYVRSLGRQLGLVKALRVGSQARLSSFRRGRTSWASTHVLNHLLVPLSYCDTKRKSEPCVWTCRTVHQIDLFYL